MVIFHLVLKHCQHFQNIKLRAKKFFWWSINLVENEENLGLLNYQSLFSFSSENFREKSTDHVINHPVNLFHVNMREFVRGIISIHLTVKSN